MASKGATWRDVAWEQGKFSEHGDFLAWLRKAFLGRLAPVWTQDYGWDVPTGFDKGRRSPRKLLNGPSSLGCSGEACIELENRS
jgi:hypothetical protein